MKRRSFLTGSVTGALGALAFGAEAKILQETAAPAETGKLMLTPAVLMAPRADGVEVVWAVSRLCRGWVELREPGGKTRKFSEDGFGFVPQGDSIMRLRINGLKPGKNYEMRAVVEACDSPPAREETPWKAFRTLNPNAAKTHFVVWNDTHDHADTLRRLHEATPQADFLLWNGDICKNEWAHEKTLISTLLNPAGQDVSAGRPLFFCWGNHDVRGKWAFRMKNVVAVPGGKPFYAFRSGPVAVICLHTGEDKPDSHKSFGGRVAFEPLRREQAAWLKKVTASPEIRDAPYKVVFCHIPLRLIDEGAENTFAGGGFNRVALESRSAWHESLVAWGAQVVISGHTHEDEWQPASEKFPYAQLVGGGPESENARWIECQADATSLRLTMHDLTGKVTREISLPPKS